MRPMDSTIDRGTTPSFVPGGQARPPPVPSSTSQSRRYMLPAKSRPDHALGTAAVDLALTIGHRFLGVHNIRLP